MAERVKLHPITPHVKRIFEIADRVKQGGIVLFPTDSRYALGCEYKNKKGIERIRKIRDLDEDDHLTILCESLSGISRFAYLSDQNFKLIKRLIPGPYTFILPATKEVPRLLIHPRKKTVGIRVPDYPICELLGREVGNPLVSISAKKPGLGDEELAKYGREPFLREFDKLVDLIIDNQQELPHRETTVIDMTADDKAIFIRKDLGADRAEEVFLSQGESFEEVPAE